MKNSIYKIVLLTIIFTSCTKHDSVKVRLYGFENQKEVKYEEGKYIFYIGFDDYIDYLTQNAKEDSLSIKDGSKKDDVWDNHFSCIKNYIENNKDNPLIIKDSIKITGLRKEVYRVQNKNDTVEHIIDVYPSDNFRWAIIFFAKKGKIKIYDKEKEKYFEQIIVDEIKSPNSAFVEILTENKDKIFNQMRWAY